MNKSQNLRLSIIVILFYFLYFSLILNLYSIQIRKSDFFKELANEQYFIKVKTDHNRGKIYDRNLNPLAINKTAYSAFIIPSSIKNLKQLKSFLKNHFPDSYKKLKSNKMNKNFLYIKRSLNKNEIKLIQKNKIEDIKLLKEPSRYYTNKTLAPVVGITNIDNQGIMGLEQKFDNDLRSKTSIQNLYKDARSGHFYFKKEKNDLGNNGKNIVLTIDSALNFLITQDLKNWAKNIQAKEAAALIINPENGDILSIANYPSFNPSKRKTLKLEKTKNRISSDAYELGSVVKIFLGIAALEENIVVLEDPIDCEGKKEIKLNGFKFSTFKAHDIITFSETIQYSNNIGVAKIALKLGPKLYNHYKKMEFGTKTGIFIGENPGFITPPKKWSKASVITLSFGYEISMTLLQLAQAFSIISNKGHLVKPRILLEDRIIKKGPIYSEKTIDEIREILEKTVNQGTAIKAKLKDFKILGKTGTARLITDGKYDPTRHIYTFAGIIEKNSYKRVIVLFIKEPNKNAYASTIAAPIFKKIAETMIMHDKLKID